MANSTRISIELAPKRLIATGSILVLSGPLLALLLHCTALSQPCPAQPPMQKDEMAEAGAQMPQKLLREGTSIDNVLVTCRASGDSLLMEFPDFRRRMSALQNLASQRILKAVIEDAQDTAWVVSGKVTEFKGRNYLFITRAQRGVKEPMKKTVL
ncbi:MAG: hypothetical protein Aurels2KO_00630 [Aureliella sp.]